jgi:hypothetical protein
MRNIVVVVAVLLCVSLAAVGCGAQKETSSSAAIQKSQTIATVQQKVDYLSAQAKAFINSKEYDQAVSVAQYILSSLDSNSQEARSLLEKAKQALTDQAKAKMEEVKKQFAGFGK